MAIFTVINIVGVKLLSESNTITVVWKIAIPVLTVVVLISLNFHPGNFHAGGGFAPFGAHGVFAALPAGVVFALQGFEQAIQLGGEARDPQRDLSRAILAAMFIGAAIYILLQVAFIGSLNPTDIAHGWSKPTGASELAPYATLAGAAGAGWLVYLLNADFAVSPAGTGLVYTGTSARLSYALGHAGELPPVLGKLSLRGVPVWSIALAFVVGELSFLPFPSWQSLVGLVTSATAMMYAFAPVSLTVLRRIDPNRHRPYRLRGANVIAPIGFAAANLIIYWGGYDTTWKIEVGLVIGLVLFALTRMSGGRGMELDLRPSAWVWPWLIGLFVLGLIGRYSSDGNPHGQLNVLPDLWDSLIVVVFGLAIYYYAVRLGVTSEKVEEAVSREEENLVAVSALDI